MRGGSRRRSTWHTSKGIKVKRAAAFRDVNAPWGVTDAWSEQSSEVRGRGRVLPKRAAVRRGTTKETRTMSARSCHAKQLAAERGAPRVFGG
jgi:hypothetical protein